MIDMFAIVVCGHCDRKRIADLSSETSLCPYCSKTQKTKNVKVLFSDADQYVVRKAFGSIDSKKYAEPEKKKGPDPDPISTLMYRYEHAADMLEKHTVLAEGLTAMKGSFDENDIEELFPGNGKKMMKMIISADIVIEMGYGKFKAI